MTSSGKKRGCGMLSLMRVLLQELKDEGAPELKGKRVSKIKGYWLKISGNSEMHAQGKDPILIEGRKAAAAATRLLDLSEINNLVKSQDQAGAREGAPGETSTTTRAEKKRKPVSLVHQAPAGWFSAL